MAELKCIQIKEVVLFGRLWTAVKEQLIPSPVRTVCSVFIPANSRESLPPKKVAIPSNGCEIVCSKSFFGQDNELQIYHGNFLIMDN